MLSVDRFVLKSLVLLVATTLGAIWATNIFVPLLAHRAGTLRAEDCIARRDWRLKLGGKVQPWRQEVERIASRTYGIEIDHAYQCCPTPYQTSYCYAFNSRMTKEILQTYPSFSLETMLVSARDRWTMDQVGEDSTDLALQTVRSRSNSD